MTPIIHLHENTFDITLPSGRHCQQSNKSKPHQLAFKGAQNNGRLYSLVWRAADIVSRDHVWIVKNPHHYTPSLLATVGPPGQGHQIRKSGGGFSCSCSASGNCEHKLAYHMWLKLGIKRDGEGEREAAERRLRNQQRRGKWNYLNLFNGVK